MRNKQQSFYQVIRLSLRQKHSVRFRVIVVTLCYLSIFVASMLTWQWFEHQQTIKTATRAKKERTFYTTKLVDKNSERMQAMLEANSNWDDLAFPMEKPDGVIKKDTLDSVALCYPQISYWILDASGTIRHHDQTDKTLTSLSLPADADWKAIFKNKITTRFFVKDGERLIEFQGATIRLTGHFSPKDRVYGYVLMARDWNPKVIKNLSNLTGSAIHIESATNKATEPELFRSDDAFFIPLKNHLGQEIVQLHVAKNQSTVATIEDATKRATAIFLGLIFLGISTWVILLYRWVHQPLSVIFRYLCGVEDKYTFNLLKQGNEFSTLAQLVRRFSKQRESLKDARERLEERVAHRTEQLNERTRELAEAEAERRRVMRSAPCLLWQANVRKNDAHLVWDINVLDEDAAFAWLPVSKTIHEQFCHAWSGSVHPEDRTRIDKNALDHMEQGLSNYRQEYRCTLADGSLCWLQEEVEIETESENAWKVYGVCTNITANKKLENQLAFQAYHDPLTALPNRAYFQFALEHAIKEFEQKQTPFAILFIDMDNLKVVNDGLGHDAGDALLLEFSRRLKEHTDGGIVARFGGDEFTVLWKETSSKEQMARMAEHLVIALSQPMLLENRQVNMGASIGLVFSPEATDIGAPPLSVAQTLSVTQLLRDADTAMYQAKSEGKRRVVVFSEVMSHQAIERLELQSDLPIALTKQEFLLHYQPILSLQDDSIQEMEALVRWEHPRFGTIAPLKFIPLAEESNLILPLGQWILEEACTQRKTWLLEYPDQHFAVSVNLSARQLQEPTLYEQIARTLERVGLEARYLKLEITESEILLNPQAILPRLENLRNLGIRIAIDDFGTGYSSMSYLNILPIDTIKIDRSFISTLGIRTEAEAIILGMIQIARSMNLKITCEGIETPEQQAILKRLGSDLGQGYLFSRPMTVDKTAAFLEAAPTLKYTKSKKLAA
jgi:diguanylate cyclase (GGDEF)-like protein